MDGDRLPDEESTVLVAVINNCADLARATEQGWYRIPVEHAPTPLTSDYLAFYLTAAFGEERWAVRYLAPLLGYALKQRKELIPEEAYHPRAENMYYCLLLGPLTRLERPVPAQKMRRLTFIHTTLSRLLAASDIRDL